MVTMVDIAQKAGVSRATVSFVLNGRSDEIRIKEETQQRILSAAKELGYRRNALAHSMVTGKTKMVAYLVHSMEAEYETYPVQGLTREAIAHGVFVKLFIWGYDEGLEKALGECLSYRPIGIVCRGIAPYDLELIRREAGREQVPVVNMDSSGTPYPCIPLIRSDDKQGCKLAIDHLIKLGHTRITHLTLSEDKRYLLLRKEGFIEAMQAHEIPVDYDTHVCQSHDMLVAGHYDPRVFEILLDDPENRPTAVFCVSDNVAMLLLQEMYSRGLRAPDDISVIGYGNLSMAAHSSPGLTTIYQPYAEIGTACLRQIMQYRDSMSVPSADIIEKILPVSLVVRNSTGAPREH